MIKKIILVYISILLTFSVQATNSYDKELSNFDDWKTIKELKESIDYLDRANAELDENFKNLDIDYEVKRFLRTNLNDNELKNVRYLISVFNTNKSKIESDITSKLKNKQTIVDEKKSLVEEKRKFFNWLIPYINVEFDDEYLNYIKVNVQIFTEKKSTDLDTKKEILNNKVWAIETKIQEHRNYINENMKKLIESKLEEKLINLSNNDTFKALSKDSKVKVLNKTIEKIAQKLDKLKINNSTNTWTLSKFWSDLMDKKVQTFIIAMSKLEDFRDTFR